MAQGPIGSAPAHYEGIKAFSETDQTDQTDDLTAIDVPVLLLHGDDDQIVPLSDAAELAVELLRQGTLKVYPGYPHGAFTIHAEDLNRDILEFIQR